LEKHGKSAKLRRGELPRNAQRIPAGTSLAMEEADDFDGRSGQLGLI
jgi:hypothetical protein